MSDGRTSKTFRLITTDRASERSGKVSASDASVLADSANASKTVSAETLLVTAAYRVSLSWLETRTIMLDKTASRASFVAESRTSRILRHKAARASHTSGRNQCVKFGICGSGGASDCCAS